MNELQAAFGLLQLKHINKAIDRRREIDALYREKLSSVAGIFPPSVPTETIYNYAYFPILIEKEYPLLRDQLNEKLRQHDIYARRYFYPLISEFPMYRDLPSAEQSNLPVARKLADRVLCLPIYPALEDEAITCITSLIKENS
jgi:dTDP-4-amino-4,6-dideoxygalactose transaminase